MPTQDWLSEMERLKDRQRRHFEDQFGDVKSATKNALEMVVLEQVGKYIVSLTNDDTAFEELCRLSMRVDLLAERTAALQDKRKCFGDTSYFNSSFCLNDYCIYRPLCEERCQ